MTTIEEAKSSLQDAIDALNARRRVTDNAQEEAALAAEVERLDKALTRLALDGLAAASQRVSEAADSMERILRTANIKPFDRAIDDSMRAIVDAAVKLTNEASKAFVFDAPRALDTPTADDDIDVSIATAAAPVRRAPAGNAAVNRPRQQAPASTADLPKIVVGRQLDALSAEYDACWDACTIRPERQADVERAADRLLRGKERYQAVSKETGVPWQLIGLMHGLECGYDFNKHLHNGDSLAAATVRVPAGRPPNWVPGSMWEDSAIDALKLKRFDRVQEWSLPRVLYALEAFNGFGYRTKRIRSPYLWSFSNLYDKGKYVADHVYDPEAVSKQLGCAVLLKHLEQQGLWP